MPISKLDTLVQSLRLEDVSEHQDHLYNAFDLVINNYAHFTAHEHKKERKVLLELLCTDEFNHPDQSRTFAVFGSLPTGESDVLLATNRIILNKAKDPVDFLPLEMMHLIEPVGGWENFAPSRFDASESIEFSRFSTTDLFNVPNPLIPTYKKIIFRLLFEGGFARVARNYGKQQAWGVIPSGVCEFVKRTGIMLWSDSNFRLKDEIEENRELFEEYDLYWGKKRLVIVQLDIDPHGPTYHSSESISNLAQEVIQFVDEAKEVG